MLEKDHFQFSESFSPLKQPSQMSITCKSFRQKDGSLHFTSQGENSSTEKQSSQSDEPVIVSSSGSKLGLLGPEIQRSEEKLQAEISQNKIDIPDGARDQINILKIKKNHVRLKSNSNAKNSQNYLFDPKSDNFYFKTDHEESKQSESPKKVALLIKKALVGSPEIANGNENATPDSESNPLFALVPSGGRRLCRN